MTTGDDARPVIRVRNLSKVYRMYGRPEDRLKQMIWRGRRRYGHDFWAVRDVSFDVHRGETVGIMGRNGSGKSTILQAIAGTLTPSAGEIEVRGRVAALLELGSGFNPEFSGRENVYVNGAILGIDREEMHRRFDQIAAFADIGEFIDQPVKVYSSGMLVRLAFAVQASIDPDILIVDEALSVGDMYFQTKCMARIADLRRRGTSILLVSHSLGTIKALCSRAILLDAGQVVMEGHPDPVGDRYVTLLMQERRTEAGPPAVASPAAMPAPDIIEPSACHPPFAARITDRFGTGRAQYVECRVMQHGREVANLVHGQLAEIRALLQYRKPVEDPGEVGVVVRTLDGIDLFAANSFLQRAAYPPQPGGVLVEVRFQFPVVLAPGVYSVSLGYRAPVQGEYIDKVFNAVAFRVDSADGTPIPFLFSVPVEFSYHVQSSGSDGARVRTVDPTG